MWDKIIEAYSFLVSDLFVPLMAKINDNTLLRIAFLFTAVTGFLFLIIWFFEEVAALDVWNGRKGRLSTVYTYPFRYSKYKANKNRVGKPEQYYKKEMSEAEKSDKLQKELIRKQKQDDYMKRNDEIRKIESQLKGVNPSYRRAVAEQMYRNKVRLVSKHAQRVNPSAGEDFDDTDEY